MTPGKLSILAGTVAMIVSMVGSGSLYMPSAVRHLGYNLAAILFPVFALISYISLCMIGSVANVFYNKNIDKEINLSYYGTTQQYSKFMAIVVDIAMILQGIGACMIYVTSITLWLFILFGFSIEESLFLYKLGVIILVSLCTSVLALLKDLSKLNKILYFSIFAVFSLMSMTIYYWLTLDSYDQIAHNSNLVANPNTMYQGISNFIFAIGCHQNIVHVYSELKKKSMKNIAIISAITVSVGLSVYMSIGMFGYNLTGSTIDNQDLLNFMFSKTSNFHDRLKDNLTNSILLKFGGIAFIIVLICAFPMQMLPTRNGITNILSLNAKFKEKINKNADRLRIIITSLLCLLVMVLTIITINYQNAVSKILTIVAATAGSSIMFMIPGILFILCNKDNIFRCVSGFLMFLFGLTFTIYSLYNLTLAYLVTLNLKENNV